MKCKEASAMIDLGNIPASWIGKLKFYMHLAHCDACQKYLKITRALSRAVIALFSGPEVAEKTDSLNNELLEKFSS